VIDARRKRSPKRLLELRASSLLLGAFSQARRTSAGVVSTDFVAKVSSVEEPTLLVP
jgi:hypothetical protein